MIKATTLRLLGMSWGVKTTCLEAPGVSLGGSGVSIGGVGSLRATGFYLKDAFHFQYEKMKRCPESKTSSPVGIPMVPGHEEDRFFGELDWSNITVAQ